MKIRYKKQLKHHVVKLLRIIIRNNKIVFPCVFDGFNDVRVILAHRVQEATLIDFIHVEKFDVQQYADSGAPSNFIAQDEIEMTLHTRSVATNILNESPIGKKQALSQLDDVWLECKVVLKHTRELEHWLLGHISFIKIIGPQKLRDNIAIQLKEGMKNNLLLNKTSDEKMTLLLRYFWVERSRCRHHDW